MFTSKGPNSEQELLPYPDLEGCEICENVIYLGKQGCFTTNEGINLAHYLFTVVLATRANIQTVEVTGTCYLAPCKYLPRTIVSVTDTGY